ncbi:MAG TPA: HAMP domain-containing sensor histidine kinase [Thermomicrobiales bacterium]|nr:HAMP domain-containing sensor histidine kinase [Thermomicrobiales bacterium]
MLILTLAIAGLALRILLVRSIDQDAQARLFAAAEEIRKQTGERQLAAQGPGGSNDIIVFPVPELDFESILTSGLSVTIIDTTGGQAMFQGGALSRIWPQRADYPAYLQLREPTFFIQRVYGQSVRGLAYPIISEDYVNPRTGFHPVIGVIFTSESLEAGNRIVHRLNQVLLTTALGGVVIATLGGWVLAGRALAPVSRIISSADDIAKGKGALSLSRRIDVPPTGDEMAQLAETFNDMLDRIEEAFAAQRRFVGDASHELRTPLTSIKGNIDVLRRQIASGRQTDPADIADALADVSRESDRMGRLVDDLLSLARTDAEGVGPTVNFDSVSLDVLAREAVRTAEVLVNGQELTLDAPEPVMIRGDGDRLVQVMLILIDNALRHTPAGGKVTLSVSTDVDPQDGIPCARIDVDDTGRGIAPEHLPHLFERFYRAENARSRHDGGTGLGLAIALSIVRAHHGWIDVESGPGQGTQFTVWLPLPTDKPAEETQQTSRRLPRIPKLRS